MIEFILIIAFTYFLYYIIHIRKYDKNGKYKGKKEEPKIPVEVELLITAYKIDLNKINYKGLLKLVGLVCSIDIATVVLIVIYLPIKSLTTRLFIGIPLVFIVILISYSILGNTLKERFGA